MLCYAILQPVDLLETDFFIQLNVLGSFPTFPIAFFAGRREIAGSMDSIWGEQATKQAHEKRILRRCEKKDFVSFLIMDRKSNSVRNSPLH